MSLLWGRHQGVLLVCHLAQQIFEKALVLQGININYIVSLKMKVKYALKKVWEKQKSIKKKMQIHPQSDFSEVTVVSLIEGRFFTS